ncbi:DUF1206 domain-containing protein [Microbacterium gorillae]|uniref:DUF1206 domain-containing protein n=1 Tax=Microbacterium gorillae TaxID=1231063 RepID=UPI00058B7469|nr:DUF1206 domain-containing protein [Microbacterium gorillae]
MGEVKQKAAEAQRSSTVRALARGGFVATGAVHVIIGIIALVIAFGGRADGDQNGALAAIAGAPFGFVLLWVIAIALWGLAVYYLLDGLLVFGGGGAKGEAKKWGRRVTAWAKAIAYAAVGFTSAKIAMGARSNGDKSAQTASQDVLHLPGGPIVLGLVGVAIAAVGIGFGVIGIRRGFEKTMSIPDGTGRSTVLALGLIGYLAKGIALLIMGILILTAAITSDPDKAGGMDGALHTLMGTPLGPVSVAVVGIGLIAYGLFCMLRARYEDL